MARKLSIAQVAPLYESVPPKFYGGTERVVSYLTEELVAQGHQVTLFASADSTTKAELISDCETSLRLNPSIKDPIAPHIMQIEKVFSMQKQFDVIHFHTDYLHFPLLKHVKTPVVTTTHGRLDQAELKPFYKKFSNAGLVSISRSQRRPMDGGNWLGNVYNGLPSNLYKPCFNPKPYLAFLGRISPEKRLDRAIEIARRAGLPLKVAAKIDNADRDYYKNIIQPLLNDPHIHFVGEIGELDKESFLGEAAGFLFPIDWPEPFGMVMIEGMACATPVLAFNNGSVPEVVTEGESGFIVNTVEQAIQKIPELLALDRRKPREYFEKNFSQKVMARNYLEVYERVINQEREARSPERIEESFFL